MRTFAPWLRQQIASGYDVHLIYVALRSAALAIRRVERRVRDGGHSIPRDTIIRRIGRSAFNVVSLYLPLAESWAEYDNSGTQQFVAASGGRLAQTIILEPTVWNRLHEAAQSEAEDK